MTNVWHSWGHVLIISALALPMVALALAALNRWRRARGATPSAAARRSLAEIGAVAGTLPWLWMVLTPTSGDTGVSLVPLLDLFDLLHGQPVTLLVQVGGNLLVLAAFGAFLPMRFAFLARTHRIVVLAASTSAAIEVTQYALDLGRVTSVDDLIINTLGALIAALCTRRWWAGAPHLPVTRPPPARAGRQTRGTS